jgi:hypothetical protein
MPPYILVEEETDIRWHAVSADEKRVSQVNRSQRSEFAGERVFYSHSYVQIDVRQPSKHKSECHNSLPYLDGWHQLTIEFSKKSMDYHLTNTMPMSVKE